jgi:hypothetical protein
MSSPPFNADIKVPPVIDRDSPTPPPAYRYEKDLVTAPEWIRENITSDFWGRIRRYLISLFPIFSWIYRYNLKWATGGILFEKYR